MWLPVTVWKKAVPPVTREVEEKFESLTLSRLRHRTIASAQNCQTWRLRFRKTGSLLTGIVGRLARLRAVGATDESILAVAARGSRILSRQVLLVFPTNHTLLLRRRFPDLGELAVWMWRSGNSTADALWAAFFNIEKLRDISPLDDNAFGF